MALTLRTRVPGLGWPN